MAKKSKKKKKDEEDFDDEKPRSLQAETIRSIAAIALFAISIFLILASFSKAGLVGTKVFEFLSTLFGIGYYLLPIVLILVGAALIAALKRDVAKIQIISGIVLFICGLGVIDILFSKGGKAGHLLSAPLLKSFGVYTAIIFLWALMAVSILIMFDIGLKFDFSRLAFWRKKELDEDLDDDSIDEIIIDPNTVDPEEYEEETPAEKPKTLIKNNYPTEEDLPLNTTRHGIQTEYAPPPLSLLEKDRGKPGVGDIKANANIIKRTLQNFGITVEMDEISIGPSVTRYALKPAEGVKLSRIVGLQNDLSLALAAHPLRIEAPIPGKSLVGIEIPNSSKTTVGLGTLLAFNEFQESSKPLLVALGRGISGECHFVNIAKMPHLLIAGATGSGKSVTIHTVITSMLYRNSPEQLKFIMVDPKRVELTMYNNIPHLLTPVITDAKKTILALKWAAKEMDRRYDILEKNKVRDIQSYHQNILEPELKKARKSGNFDELPDTMPYIVVVIDELADIMQAYPRELESSIVRLAQMSRAVGIHLILSTQRPSVNVITGLIKANVPARIALQVASQIDSRTILDMAGAEKLLGAGDMLYLSGEMPQPRRIQSAFISEEEVKSVVDYLADSYKDSLPSDIDFASAQASKNAIFESGIDSDSGDDEDEDDMYEEARQTVIEAGKASTSYIQRKLRIGYARAARLMDILEDRGVIGPADGARPREILVNTEEEESSPQEDIPMEDSQ